MNSILRQYQISTKDLSDYVRTYAPASRIEPDQWVKSINITLTAGTIIFCLDTAPNATSTDEIFRVKDLCTAIGKENGRDLVLNITSGAYELRFIESLLVEKAKKSILANKPFNYVIARPPQQIPETTIKKIEQLSSIYARGGSRRNLLGEKDGPPEPLLAFLSALGIILDLPNNKQLLDIGSICHMIFVDTGNEQDKNRTLLRAWFKAEPNQPVNTPALAVNRAIETPGGLVEVDEKIAQRTTNNVIDDDDPSPTQHWEAAATLPTLTDYKSIPEFQTNFAAPTPDSTVSAEPQIEQVAAIAPDSAATSEDINIPDQPSSAQPHPLEEPKLVMTEMSSLMSKLEQQVSKAAKKLASRAEEIERRLNSQLEALLEEANQDDKNIKAPLLVLSDSLSKQFQDLADSLHNKIIETATSGRDSIKELFTSNQIKLETDREANSESLGKDCQDFRNHAKILSKSSEDKLKILGRERVIDLQNMVKETFEQLTETGDSFEKRLKQRFQRFQERMAEETQSVLSALDRNASAMQEEIDSSWERAAEKLASSKTDFELSIEHTLKTAELSISQATRTLLVDQYLPKLRERREVIASIADEMCNSFSEQSHGQSNSQLEGLTTSLTSARKHLEGLAQECLTRLETSGREQQSGLEEIFKESSTHIEANTETVASELTKTEAIINEGESACKKLAETSSLDSNPSLAEKHALAWTQAEKSHMQAKNELNHTLETSCTRLENFAQNFQSQLNSFRLDEIQQARCDCENGLNRIREAIQETLSAIQTSREKFME